MHNNNNNNNDTATDNDDGDGGEASLPVRGSPCKNHRIVDLKQAAIRHGVSAWAWDKRRLCKHFGLVGPVGRYAGDGTKPQPLRRRRQRQRQGGQQRQQQPAPPTASPAVATSPPQRRRGRPKAAEDRCHPRTLSELRDTAERLGLHGYKLMRKAEICDAVLLAEAQLADARVGSHFDPGDAEADASRMCWAHALLERSISHPDGGPFRWRRRGGHDSPPDVRIEPGSLPRAELLRWMADPASFDALPEMRRRLGAFVESVASAASPGGSKRPVRLFGFAPSAGKLRRVASLDGDEAFALSVRAYGVDARRRIPWSELQAETAEKGFRALFERAWERELERYLPRSCASPRYGFFDVFGGDVRVLPDMSEGRTFPTFELWTALSPIDPPPGSRRSDGDSDSGSGSGNDTGDGGRRPIGTIRIQRAEDLVAMIGRRGAEEVLISAASTCASPLLSARYVRERLHRALAEADSPEVRHLTLLATSGRDRIAGVAVFSFQTRKPKGKGADERMPPWGDILLDLLCVEATARRSGVGKSFLSMAEREAAAWYAEETGRLPRSLWVEPAPGSFPFYLAYGFGSSPLEMYLVKPANAKTDAL
jgi:GNAT superfamily N-acetyltransferase